MDEERAVEDELMRRQDGRLYPVGQVLRATYDAENHDSLGNDVTGLMLDLSRVPYEPFERDTPRPPAAVSADASRPSLLHRVRDLLHR